MNVYLEGEYAELGAGGLIKHQEETIKAFGESSIVMNCAPTGAGKTKAAHLGTKFYALDEDVLFVAPTNALVSQHKEDAQTLYKAMIISDRILFSAGAIKVLNGNFVVPQVNSAAELDKISRNKKTKVIDWMLMAFHPQGTCRMGINPKNSVVGPKGECHEINNLFIADASVFPTSLGVNPQETVWAIAIKVAEAIAEGVRASHSHIRP